MYQPLATCPACSRHVHIGESDCPFCGRTLPADFAGRVVPGANVRLGRAAMFVFGSSLAAAGCAGTVGPGEDSAAPDNGGIVPLYGVPDRDAATEDTGGTGLRYGAPPPVDAGPQDAGTVMPLYGDPQPVDAGVDAGPAPRYGAPPAPDAW
jgi:hypothetical protein